ncbi:MAG TPA: NAD(P)H-dependent glycerol-3-phosphate dehydrogenase [Armatimonadota bacterium]|jgi:glycerol-3-phosphate dehydrogenase (NAD(P)+)
MTIAVLGAGSWGTALARLLGEKGHAVRLWDHDVRRAANIQRDRVNARYLPSFELPHSVIVTGDARYATAEAEAIVIAVPSSAVRSLLNEHGGHFVDVPAVLSAAKGLEPSTGMRVSEICIELLGEAARPRLAVLSGPNLATELARNVPTATVIASENRELATLLQCILHTRYLRPYTSEDVIGVELGGALKNIIAIAAGISDGLGYGDNTKASLMTRGLAEIIRLGEKLGARRDTFWGLSGVGDMIATCAGRLSRNYRVGAGLAEGKSLETVLAEMGQVAEGVPTTEAAIRLSERAGVEAPIIKSAYSVLFGGTPAIRATSELMERGAKGELW